MADKPFRKRRAGESKADYQRKKRQYDSINSGGGNQRGVRRGEKTLQHRTWGDESSDAPLGVGWDYVAHRPEYQPTGRELPKGGGGSTLHGGAAHLGDAGHQAKLGSIAVAPRYFPGAVTEIFGTMDTDSFLGVQDALVRLGLLGENSIAGSLSGENSSALKQMLGAANAEGKTWERWLTEKVKAMDDAGLDFSSSTGEAARPLTLQLANPDEIKADVTEQSTSLLGGNYAGNPQHYVDEIHAQQTKAQTDYYNQTGGAHPSDADGGPGGTTYDPASVKALIMKEHPVDYSVEQTGSNAQAVLESLIGRHSPELRG